MAKKTSSSFSSFSFTFSLIFTFILIIFSFLIIFVGYFSHQNITKLNKCEMTYSSPELYKIKINNYNNTLFQLYIHNKNTIDLKPIPVLFIPGNNGS